MRLEKPYLFFLFIFPQFLFSQEKLTFRFEAIPTKDNPTMQVFLQNLRAEEAKYPLVEQENTQLMTTRLRKIFYGSPNYDKYLIKGVAAIQPPYTIREVAVPNFDKNFKTPLGLTVRVIDTVAMPADSSETGAPLRENPYLSQEIQLSEKKVTDIGHTLCGIDAAFHPNSITPPKILGMNISKIKLDNNQHGITWIGDLGSVVAEVYFAERRQKRKLQVLEQQQIADVLSSPADNLGNVDSYIAAQLFLKENNHKVADLLEKLYLSDELYVKQLRQNRYLIFAKAIGLEWNGNEFVNEAKMLRYYSDQVNDAAAFYYAISAKRGGKWNVVKALPSILKISKSAYAKTVVEAFFEALKKEIKANL